MRYLRQALAYPDLNDLFLRDTVYVTYVMVGRVGVCRWHGPTQLHQG